MEITSSLDKAIKYYLLACSARNARGQGQKHCCMLIHTTVYVAPHFNTKIRIGEHLQQLQREVDWVTQDCYQSWNNFGLMSSPEFSRSNSITPNRFRDNPLT